jgi:hypothetical protein
VIVAVDWDHTLVDRQQEWLPGAERALNDLIRMCDHVIIHTCRASWPQGLEGIVAKLGRTARFVSVEAKPLADIYIDDKAVRYTGDWDETLDGLLAIARNG